ncbi:hypothetical protein V5O48_017895, partial [Marasmius crinis-equi]
MTDASAAGAENPAKTPSPSQTPVSLSRHSTPQHDKDVPQSPSQTCLKSPPVSMEEVVDEDNVNRPPRIPSTSHSKTPRPSPSSATAEDSQPSSSAPPKAGSKAPEAANQTKVAKKKNGTGKITKKNSKKSSKEDGNEDNEELDDEDEDNEDNFSEILRGRGLSGIVEKERVEWLESMLPSYLALGNCVREKTEWWEAFPPQYFSLFPLSKYPAPPMTLEPLPVLSKEKLKKMSRSQKNARKKKEQRRAATDEQRTIAGRSNKGQQSNLDKFFRQLKICPKPPKKLPLYQFLMNHPKHQDTIKDNSEETGEEDRLPERTKAARDYVESLSAVQRPCSF